MISLLEANIDVPESVTTNAKFCIRGHHAPDKYTLAISAYALFMVRWDSEAVKYLDKLIKGVLLSKSSKQQSTVDLQNALILFHFYFRWYRCYISSRY